MTIGIVETPETLEREWHLSFTPTFQSLDGTDCVYCHALLPELKQAQARYGAHGLRIVGINIGGEHREDAAAYVKDDAVNYLTLAARARNLDVAQAYGVMGTPTLVVIAPEGRIL